MNNSTIKWDLELIKRYDLSGPRYTSYPTAIQFSNALTEQQLVEAAQDTADVQSPLSLYIHIPFCTHVCYFCACNKIITRSKKRAEPYLERLFIEAEQLGKLYSNNRIVNQLHLGGGTPTFISDEQMKSLLDHLRQHFHLRDDNEGDYSIEIDPREADANRVKKLAQMGFNRISLGVQDIQLAVQEAVNRVQPIEMTEEIILSAREAGIKSINTDLIYGLPHQTIDSFDQTLDRIIELSPDRLSVFNYAHMPDRFRPQKHINETDLPNPQDKLIILENTINKLLNAGYVYIGMDHFAKPDDELSIAQQEGHLHRNFQGYTTHSDCDLVAMGVSAISQIGDTYYQNEHDIEAYQTAVDARKIAIKRGVMLNKDDKIRRQIITQLICHFELDPKNIEDSFNVDFKSYFGPEIETLGKFEADGLIRWQQGRLHVTPAGRLLIRRICMCFDAYIPKQQSQRTYSRII